MRDPAVSEPDEQLTRDDGPCAERPLLVEDLIDLQQTHDVFRIRTNADENRDREAP